MRGQLSDPTVLPNPGVGWRTEAEMLRAFAEEARALGFRVVPECCGHDLVLVAGPGTSAALSEQGYGRGRGGSALEDGDAVAVEGKLSANVTLLRQALPPHRRRSWSRAHPAADFYAVVIPHRNPDFEDVAAANDICTISMLPPRKSGRARWSGVLPARLDGMNLQHGFRVLGYPRLEVPDLDVRMDGGHPSPRQLTPWKIAAVKLCLSALGGREIRDADFTGPLRLRTFRDRGWVELVRREGRSGVYVLADGPGRPDLHYPEIAEALVRAGPGS